MTYKHGVYIDEVDTSILPATEVDSAIPVFIGTAPLHLSETGAAADLDEKVNVPVLCYTYEEACNTLGFTSDSSRWDDYTLAECVYSQFSLFGISPAIFINVLDPSNSSHVTEHAASDLTVVSQQVNLGADVIADSVTVKASSEGEDLVAGEDYSISYDSDGNCVVNVLDGGAAESAEALYIGYTTLNPSAVDSDDIIGGYDTQSGKYTGLELVDQVYPKFGLVPGNIVAPKFSMNSGVAAVMETKAESVSGSFKAMALIDLSSDDSEGASKYTDVPELKEKINVVNEHQVACWPLATLDGKVYHISVLLAGLMGSVDSEWNDRPVKSPSNETLPIDGVCNAAGEEINLTQEQANYLNGEGITTVINLGGWKFWGNRTAIYPNSTDPKDAFIPVRRMFNWIGNTLVTTWLQRIDYPITQRTIETMLDSIGIWLNGLAADECLVGSPSVKFLEDENPTTSLMDGIVALHVYITPPSPMRELDFTLEYDVDQLETLFSTSE